MPFSLKDFAIAWWRYLAGVLVVGAVVWYFFFSGGNGLGATLTIAQGDFSEQIRVSGTVVAARDVDLGFAANGRISGTYARVGDHVAQGALLAQTENGDLSAALAQKQAALAEARANLAAIEAGTRPEEIAVATAGVRNAEAALVDAVQSAYTTSDDAVHNTVDTFFTNPSTNPKLTFFTTNSILKSTVEQDRLVIESVFLTWALLVSNLSPENASDSAAQAQSYLTSVTTLLADANKAINQGVADSTTSTAALASYATSLATARASVNTAAAALTAAVTALDSAEKNLSLKQAGSTAEDIAAGQAAVAAARANVENAQAELAKTRVVAPFSGTVTRMDAKTGEIVSPSASLISMQSDGVFQIETYVPEVSIAQVAPGNRATTTLDAYGTVAAFPATVIAVDPAETVKDGVPTYKTTLSFLSVDPRIRSGMTANVAIETGILHDAIVIPAGAVGTKNGASYVSVVDRGNAIDRAVTTGASPALGQIEILSGLSAGDVILLAPIP